MRLFLSQHLVIWCPKTSMKILKGLCESTSLHSKKFAAIFDPFLFARLSYSEKAHLDFRLQIDSSLKLLGFLLVIEIFLGFPIAIANIYSSPIKQQSLLITTINIKGPSRI